MQGRDSDPAQWRWQPRAGSDGQGDGRPLGDSWSLDDTPGEHGEPHGSTWPKEADHDRDADLASLFRGPPEGTAERAVPARRTGRMLLPAIVAMAALAIVVVSVAAALLVRLPSALPNPPVARASDPAAVTEQPATPAPAPTSALGGASGITAATLDGGPALLAVRVAATDTPRHVLHAGIVASTSVGVLTVVTVDAVVLDGQAGSWAPPRHARFGVAQRTDDGTVVGGPWALPPPDPAPEPTWQTLRDPERAVAVREVLAAAGFLELPDLDPGGDGGDGGDGDPAIGLFRSSELPGVLRAEVLVRAPGAPAAERQQVWLHDAARPALLGGR